MGEPIDAERAFMTGRALRDGMTRRDLESELLARPFHGLHAVRRGPSRDADYRSAGERQRLTIADSAEQFAEYMALGEFFSHTTAAVLWGIPLPLLDERGLHVSVLAPGRAPRGAGVHGHQLAGRDVEILMHPELDVRLTSAASTWALLGVLLRHPYDLVAAADGILRADRVGGPRGFTRRPALAGIAQLASAVPFRRKGAVALREALARARVGVASRPETWLRLTVVDAGFPEPETDVDVYGDGGDYIGTVDLAYRDAKVCLEYEGDHHRTDSVQWNRDIEKHRALTEAGWRVIRVTATMLFGEPSRVVAAVREARASAFRA